MSCGSWLEEEGRRVAFMPTLSGRESAIRAVVIVQPTQFLYNDDGACITY